MIENKNALDLIYLVSCAVKDITPDPERVRAMDLDAVYALAARHSIKAAVAMALESAGCKDSRSAEAIASSVRKTVIFDNEWAAIRVALEDAGIWYIPLKGAVLKSYYPKLGMREFADFDILYDAERAEDVKKIMEGRGFHTEQFGTSNHDIYHKKPVLNFEMHSALFKELNEEELHNYYKDIGSKLLGEGPEKHLKPEDFYLYIVAHEYKHFNLVGTGLKAIMDTYVCLKELDLDMRYVSEEAESIGIRDFEEAMRNLSIDLFDGKELSGSEQDMLDFILLSGTYGNYNTHVSYLIGNSRFGKLGYMLGRFLVPVSKKNANYKAYARSYPVFYKYKVLLPILPFYRTVRAIFTGSFRKEANAIKRTKTKG